MKEGGSLEAKELDGKAVIFKLSKLSLSWVDSIDRVLSASNHNKMEASHNERVEKLHISVRRDKKYARRAYSWPNNNHFHHPSTLFLPQFRTHILGKAFQSFES